MATYIYDDDIEEVKREGNKVFFRLSEETTKELIKDLIRGFINNGEIKHLELAFKSTPEKFSKFFVNEIENELDRYDGDIFYVIDKMELLKQKFGVNVEEIIRKNKDKINSLNVSTLVLLFRKIEFEEIFIKKVVGYKVRECLDSYYDYKKQIQNVIELSQINKEFVKKAIEKHFDKFIFWEIDNYWRDFVELGRGGYFESVVDRIIAINTLYENNLLSEKCLNKFKKFLLERLDEIDRLIKRRMKKENHQDYIKILIKFLPPEYQKNYISYFI